MSAPTVQSCPREVLALIFGHFECALPVKEWWMNEIDRSPVVTLKSLCLTCRMFKDIAQPLLFRNVLLWGNENSTISLIRLAKVLLENPSLGLYTRIFSFDYVRSLYRYKEEWSEILQRKSKVPEKMRAFFENTFSEYQVNTLAFCMAFMPNLQVVDLMHSNSTLPSLDSFIDTTNFSLAEHSKQPLHTATVTEPFTNFGLPLLREIRIQHPGNEGDTDIDEVEAVLLHPGVEIIRTVGIDWRGEQAAKLTCKESISNVRALELRECIIDQSGLENIFSRCPKLEGLSISLGDARRSIKIREGEWEASANQFGRVLREKGQMLKTLNLHTTEPDGCWSDEDGIVSSLKELKELRHVAFLKNDLAPRKYFGDDDSNGEKPTLKELLPSNLETFYLHCTKWEFPDDFSYKWEHKNLDEEFYDMITGEDFPKLRQIIVERDYTDRRSFGDISPGWDDERPFGHTIPGWSVEIVMEHLWNRPPSTGCMRSLLVFRKQEQLSTGVKRMGFHSNSHELV